MKQLGFGFGQLLKTPPVWLVAVIAVMYIVMFITQQIIIGDPTILDAVKVKYLNYLTNAMSGLLMLGALVGVKPSKDKEEV
jgi:hypothetical protein